MKKTSLLAVLLCVLMITACTGQYEEDKSDYETEETQTEVVVEETEVDDSSSAQEIQSTEAFGQSAREYLQAIAGDIGSREPGSDAEAETAVYIQGILEGFGYEVEVQPFTFIDEDDGEEYSSANVIATKPGDSDEVIVVGAHYDSTYEEGSMGADDNASGVAVMLEAAEQLYDEETPYTIVFAAFGAEEYDLNGSTYYVDQMDEADLAQIINMINLDSLIAGDITYVYGTEGSDSTLEWMLQDADNMDAELEGKFGEDLDNEDGTPCECSDYDAFVKAGIPFAYFEATNWNLSPDAMTQVDPQYGVDGEIRHTEYDTIEYLDETFPGRIDEHLNLYVSLLYDLLTQYQ